MGPSRRATTGPGRQRIKDPDRRPARLGPSAPCQATHTLEGGRPGNLTTAAATRRSCTHETRCARNSGCSTTDTSVWPTNNISERGVRPLKTQQKISGRLASNDITQDRLDIRSYIDTARKHGHNAMDVLHNLMLGRPWQPPAPAFSP